MLEEVDVWSSGDEVQVSADHSAALENFKPYRRRKMLEGSVSDVSVLIT